MLWPKCMQQTVVEEQDPRQSQILPGWRRELWMTDEVKSSVGGRARLWHSPL